MSMQRLLLRTAVVGALDGKTIAGARVYDSRIDPPADLKQDQIVPFLSVYSDWDTRANQAIGGGTMINRRIVEIRIEMALATWSSVRGGADPDAVAESELGVPITDPELEMLLDMLEWQVWCAWFGSHEAAVRLQKMVQTIEEWESIPGRSPDGNQKIAARELTVRCRVADDCRPDQFPAELVAGATSESSTFVPLIERAPYLAPMLADIAAKPGMESLATLIGQLTGADPADRAPLFETARMSVDYVDPVVDPYLLDEGETQGPDGRIEIQADVEIPQE